MGFGDYAPEIEITPEIAAQLEAANIPPDWWPYCYIADDGTIYTPEMDDEGAVVYTGEQRYNGEPEQQLSYTLLRAKPLDERLAEHDASLADVQAVLADLLYGGGTV